MCALWAGVYVSESSLVSSSWTSQLVGKEAWQTGIRVAVGLDWILRRPGGLRAGYWRE